VRPRKLLAVVGVLLLVLCTRGRAQAQPVITNPAANSTASGTVTFSCTDAGGTTGLYVDDVWVANGFYPWNTRTYSNGSHYLLCNGFIGGVYNGQVAFNVTVNNSGATPTPIPPTATPVPPTPTPPAATPTPGSLTITSPVANTRVSGTILFSCSEPGGTTGLYINDVWVGSGSYSWNTTTGANGSYYLLCNGYLNGVGNGQIAGTVTVSNGGSPTPISSPTSAATPSPTGAPTPSPTKAPSPTASPTPTSSTGSIPGPPSFASNYRLVLAQDFTTMTSLAVNQTSAAPNTLTVNNLLNGGTVGAPWNGIWTSHTPLNEDWFTFQAPTAAYAPFNVGNGFLTIRAQQDGNDPNYEFGGFSGGLLSSIDETGAGFAQQYGYFEASMQTPGGANTWPAFWMMSQPGVANYNLTNGEVDVTESYGNYGQAVGIPGNPNVSTSSNSRYTSKNTGATAVSGQADSAVQPTSGTLMSSYHQYGVDIEPTSITWYLDRVEVASLPISSSTYPEYQEPMYVMLDLALGGGNIPPGTSAYNWALTPDPSDLKVQYVAVWASPNSPNFSASSTPTPTATP